MGAGGQGTKKDFLNTEILKHISLLVGTSQGGETPMKGRKRKSCGCSVLRGPPAPWWERLSCPFPGGETEGGEVRRCAQGHT